MVVDFEELLEETKSSEDVGMFESLIYNTKRADKIFTDDETFLLKEKNTNEPQNCKSKEANYILSNGSVSEEYLKLREDANARYKEIQTRLSTDI